jgi:Abnormal spindle-like microcephaly-assoc'd, ASPM-SPD-2-Hydin/HYDIN/CFA65/VesB-like, Ig-like domain/IPT/TIG domain/Cep192 domain 4
VTRRMAAILAVVAGIILGVANLAAAQPPPSTDPGSGPASSTSGTIPSPTPASTAAPEPTTTTTAPPATAAPPPTTTQQPTTTSPPPSAQPSESPGRSPQHPAANPAVRAAADPPAVSFDPASVDFGDVVVGTTSQPAQRVTVTNTGTADLHVTGSQTAAPFAVSIDNCAGIAVAPGESCNIFVSFSPTQLGPASGTLSVTDDAAGSPQSVPLAGNGVGPPEVTVSPTSIDFGDVLVGQQASRTVTVTNTGGSSMVIKGVGATGGFTIDLNTNTCAGATLGVQQSCQFDVLFAPHNVGPFTGQAEIVDTAPGSPHIVPLSGTAVGPLVSLNPTSIDFGDRMVGSITTTVVVVTNTGTADLHVSSAAVTGPPFSVVGDQCSGVPVAPNDSCSIFVRFAPTQVGLASDSLQISDDAEDSPQAVPMSGNATPAAPVVSLSPTSVDFGNVALNTTSPEHLVTVTNTGTADLHVTGASVGPGASGFNFGPTDTCSHQTIAPGGSCQTGVVFTPNQLGAKAGTLSFEDDASSSPQTVPLSGTGVQPAVSLNPTSLNFGDRQVGSTTTTVVVVSNTGTGDLHVSGTQVAAPYSIPVDQCTGTTVAPGDSCQVFVSFKPTQIGVAGDTLLISDDAPGSPQSVPMQGRGVAPLVSVSPNPVLFGNVPVGGSGSVAVTIANTGNTDLHLTDFTASSPFSIDQVQGSCIVGVAIKPGDSCALVLHVAPTTSGLQTGTFTITDDAPDSPQQVPLYATAGPTPQPAVVVSPNPVAFGDVAVGSRGKQNFTITNVGSADLHVSDTTASAPFSVSGVVGSCIPGAPIAPGDSCVGELDFDPTAPGSATGSMTVTDDAPDSPQVVPLSGTGVSPAVSVSPASVAFGDVRVGTTATQAVTVTNTGNADLHISALGVPAIPFGIGTQTCNGATVPPQQSCVIDVTFHPAQTGPASGTLGIADDAPGGGQSVPLSGTGTEPAISITPNPVAFGDVPTGAVGKQTVTIQNTGTADLTLTSFGVTGPFAINAAGNACTFNSPIPPTGTCTTEVDFSPTTLGPASGVLSVSDDAPGSPQTVPLAGNGVAPAVSLNPTSINFGDVRVGDFKADLLTVTNSGTGDLHVSSIATAAPFSVDFDNCSGITVAPDGTCDLFVRFTPTQTGPSAGSLSIVDDAPGSPQTVPLAGNGTEPAISIAPNPVAFGDVPTGGVGKQSVTIQNIGTADLTLASFGVSGPFAINQAANACIFNSAIPPGGACTTEVDFSPTAPGPATGTLTVSDDAPGSPQTVPLSGNGVAPAVSINPPAVNFGDVAIGQISPPATVTLTNTGNLDLHLSAVNVSGLGFGFGGNACGGAALKPGDSCTVQVQFQPTQAGQATGNISFTDDAAGSPQVVPLSGNGLKPPPTVSGLAPDHGPAAGGTVVTIQGEAFVPGETTVTIGGTVVPADQVAIAGDPTATFITPAHSAGPVQVIVSTPSGVAAALTFTYDASPPSPSSFAPGNPSLFAPSNTSLFSPGRPSSATPSSSGTRTGLAFTGLNLAVTVGFGLLLLAGGALALALSRRRVRRATR